MKPADIKVGKTYVNRGAGRTRRKVLEISKELKAAWYSDSVPPDEEPVVRYEQKGHVGHNLYLRSFASWAGREIE